MVPDTVEEAQSIVAGCKATDLRSLDHSAFVRAWAAVAYIYPGLHPDGFEARDSGWPDELRPFAAEAWRRACAGSLDDSELYPANAAWARLHDGAPFHSASESGRRARIRELGLSA
ncbi:MAG: hypothetical protein JJU00_18440 [Opitutales bacterium]|nr:hypothetical protein [Opitutales bacterium]